MHVLEEQHGLAKRLLAVSLRVVSHETGRHERPVSYWVNRTLASISSEGPPSGVKRYTYGPRAT
jgi:hypothetical protein